MINSKWDSKMFREIIKQHLGTTTGNGKSLDTQKDVYEYLSNKTNLAAPSTFENWTKPSSNGPSIATIRALERFFNTSLTRVEKTLNVTEGKSIRGYSQFVCDRIYTIISSVKNYLQSSDFGDEDSYYQMLSTVEFETLFVPDEIGCLILSFITQKLEPTIQDWDLIFGGIPELVTVMRYAIDLDRSFDELVISRIKPYMVN